MRRLSCALLGLAAALWMIGDDSLFAQAIPNTKCLTLSGVRQCFGTGTDYCGTLATCGGTCGYCASTVVLPNTVCAAYPEQTCTPKDVGLSCGRSDLMKGSCKKVAGSNNCTCENPMVVGNCQGTSYPGC
jgi:hypothetical protein